MTTPRSAIFSCSAASRTSPIEQPIGGGPGKRHHVRFWRADELYDGIPIWFGAATYNSSVGLSHTTGQVTHHITPGWASTPSVTA